MKQPLLSLLVLVLGFAACKQVDEIASPEDTLRGGSWRRTSLKKTYKDPATNKDTTVEQYAQLDTCVKDNRLEFKGNHEGVEQRNGQKCSAGDPDTAPFFWELTDAGKGIRIYNAPETFSANASINADILTLTGSLVTFRYSHTDVDPMNPQNKTVTTYTEEFRR